MKKLCVFVSLCSIIALASCADNDIQNDGGREAAVYDPVGQPVLFSSGNMAETPTRADALGSTEPYYHGMNSTTGVPYMPEDGRFVCTMYYHSKSTDTDASAFDIADAADGGTLKTSWLLVNDKVGNSVYRNNTFGMPEFLDVDGDGDNDNPDEYGFDRKATIFFWQNRLTHAFLALADNHQLTTNDGATTTLGKLKLYPDYDKDLKAPGEGATEEENAASNASKLTDKDRFVNTFDLTRGGEWAVRVKTDGENNPVKDTDGNEVKELYQKTAYTLNAFSGQPDPILALTIMKPSGATQEANRVRLYFKHQFSQIQVNVKALEVANSTITSNQIEKVELLGVSEEGYVCCRLNADGTVGAATAKTVNVEDYDDDWLAFNEWGTSFEMFDMKTETDADGDGIDDGYVTGYLKSFNAIAFGRLEAIRVTWREGETKENPIVRHVSTFRVPATNETESSDADSSGDKKPVVKLQELQSGMKYVYNLELRRGTLAVVRTVVLPWDQKDDLVHEDKGTIEE